LSVHDLADLDFATGLLQTQRGAPVMQSEFQAGWLQGADEGAPRPSDPSSTALALGELLRDGAHGIVNFPAQDTIYPHGWEAPWANWSYGWDAALTVDLRPSARYAPTAQVGDAVRAYGGLLAKTHVAADAAIVWPPSLFVPSSLTNADFAAFAAATIAMQRACNARGLTCVLADLAGADEPALRRYRGVLLPIVPSSVAAGRLQPWAAPRIAALQREGRLVADRAAVRGAARLGSDTTLLLADDASYAFVLAVNPSGAARTAGPFRIALANRTVRIAAFGVPARGARIVPVGLSRAWHAGGIAFGAVGGAGRFVAPATPPPFSDPDGTVMSNGRLRVVFAPFAGARIAELGDGHANAATGIGLLRDATDPQPPVSARDYIAAYTHPLPAGTFNRPYQCQREDAFTTQRVACTYDAPDVPQGGAAFRRTLTLNPSSGELIVGEEFAPHDRASTARLESISGFAWSTGDEVVQSPGGSALGILHGRRLTTLRWRPGDVKRVVLEQRRGAELVTLVFARRSVELRLGVTTAANPAEARKAARALP
jgi:hypothetical protein